MFKKTFFLFIIFLFSLISPSVFSKDILFVCNSDREEYFFENRMFRLFDEFQLKINIRKKLIDVNFNHLWEFKDSETDYENFKIINLNHVFKRVINSLIKVSTFNPFKVRFIVKGKLSLTYMLED